MLEDEIKEHIVAGRLPKDNQVVRALKSIPDPAHRVIMANRLAKENPSIKVVLNACERFLRIKKEIREKKKEQAQQSAQIKHSQRLHTRRSLMLDVPALEVSGIGKEERPEWDALYQVGKVPPWQVFTNSMMATCDTCSLRPNASEVTCGECPLVQFCKITLESLNGK
jgi:hypothetical protein